MGEFGVDGRGQCARHAHVCALLAQLGTDASGDDKNEIRSAVTPDHRDYAQVMGAAPSLGQQSPAANSAPVSQSAAAPVPGRPAWAQ